MNQTLLDKLPGESLLKVLEPVELTELLSQAREAKAKKGDAVIRQGDNGDALLILLEGQARVTVYTANGREIVLEYVGPGTVLGEIALLDGGVRTASVIAMGPLKYLILPRSVFEHVIASNHRIALRLMKELATRLRRANQTIETDRAYAAASRLARFLLRLAYENGEAGDAIRLSQTELSMFAGISRENINRQLSLWQQDGIVAVSHGGVTIMDREALEEVADAME
ncbi:MAG TPA: Crp/Fnr family transcriptional regulator [Sphingobium sp.]|uniref:Crp/Fnr family transcriptional regulator n=1 Tax=Sphingobium sp. TaxID=1912891 RepID=UPI002ED32955